MLTNSEVTLFRYNEKTDEYERVGTFRAWVHREDRLRKSTAGESSRNSVTARIAAGLLAEARTGDRLYLGRVDRADEGKAYETVQRVHDNRYGSEPHWTLETRYQYAR